jgi:hypothetical protein
MMFPSFSPAFSIFSIVFPSFFLHPIPELPRPIWTQHARWSASERRWRHLPWPALISR